MSELNPTYVDILENALDGKIAKRTGVKISNYEGTVSRIDAHGAAWVRLVGSTEDVPIFGTAAFYNPGDQVVVSFRNGRAYIDGNYTAPAVSGDAVAQMIEPAAYTARASYIAAEAANTVAKEAMAAAMAEDQHFWHNRNGAHVTDSEQDEFVDAEAAGFPDWQPDPGEPEYKPWYNVLLNSLGQLFRTADKILASFTHSAIAFYDGEGNTDENIIAQFGKDGARIGKLSSNHVTIDQNGMNIVSGSDYALINGVDVVAANNTANGAMQYAQNINVGGRNLLAWTQDPTAHYNRGDVVIDRPWNIGSGGNGSGSIADVSDSPVQYLKKSFRISNNTTGNRDFQQHVPDIVEQGTNGEWIFSAYVRAIGESCTGRVRVWDSAQRFSKTFTATTQWTAIAIPVTVSALDLSAPHCRLLMGLSGAGSIEYIAPKLERGNKPTDWTPAPEDIDSDIYTTQSSLENYKATTNSTLGELQAQLDGQIEAWYFSTPPSMSTEPTSSWTTDALKERHRGDIYYDVTTGHSWRFMYDSGSWQWQQIPDSDAAAALSVAQNAQTLAGTKRRIFVTTPTVPYDVGDLWVNGETVKFAKQLRTASGSFNYNDWEQTATDDTLAEEARRLANEAQIYAEGIEIGGRNLLLGSMNVSGSAYEPGWVENGTYTPVVEKVIIDGEECIHFKGTPTGKNIPSISARSRVNLEWGKTYTMSCDMKFDKAITTTAQTPNHFHVGSVADYNVYDLSILNKGGGVTDNGSIEPEVGTTIPANTWVRYVRTFTTDSEAPDQSYPVPVLRPFIYGDVRVTSATTEVNGWMKNFKIEAGNKPTAYSLAPENVAARDTNAPNLTPWHAHPIDDYYDATTNQNAYWRYLHARNNSVTNDEGIHAIYDDPARDPVTWPDELIGNGWAHVTLDARAGTKTNCYMNTHLNFGKLNVKEGVKYTWLAEVRNLTWSGDTGQTLEILPSIGNATLDKLSSSVTAGMQFTSDGVGRAVVTAKSDFSVLSGTQDTSGYYRVPKGSYADFWVRVSLYECPVINDVIMAYEGPYKPYVPTPTAVYEAQAAADSAQTTANGAQTAATNAQSTANTARTEAGAAQTAATNAQSTANTARTEAGAAQSTANTARTEASAAQSTANNAQATATAAQTAANNAKTAADNAQSYAESIGGFRVLQSSYTNPRATIEGWAAEGTSGSWAVSDTTGVRTGDTVYIKTAPSDNGGMALYCILEVTSVTSATRLVGTSHGWVDTQTGAVARDAQTTASSAQSAASAAQSTANSAQATANKTKENFWADSSGVHISTTSNSATGSFNSLFTSTALLFRKAANNLAKMTGGAIEFFDGLGNGPANIVASFGTTGAQVGALDQDHVDVESGGVYVRNGTATGARLLVNQTVGTYPVNPNTGSPPVYTDTAVLDAGDSTHVAVKGNVALSDTLFALPSRAISKANQFEFWGNQQFWKQSTAGTDIISQITCRYFGDKITTSGGIETITPNEDWTLNVLKVICRSSAYGHAVLLGGGGCTVIGGGEAAQNVFNAEGVAPDAETVFVAADTTVSIFSNCNTVANRKEWLFQTNGYLSAPDWIVIRSSNISRNTDPSAKVSGKGYTIYDSSGKRLLTLRPDQATNGTVTLNLGVFSEKSDGTEVVNWFTMGATRAGSRTYSVTDPNAFRNSIGASNGVWPVSLGGTGATNANEAARALGMAKTAGDSWTMDGDVISGHLTNARKQIQLAIHFPYRLYGVTGATISGRAVIRQNGKYLFGSSGSADVDISAEFEAGISVWPREAGFLVVNMNTNVEETNGLNNAPLSIKFNSLTVTLT